MSVDSRRNLAREYDGPKTVRALIAQARRDSDQCSMNAIGTQPISIGCNHIGSSTV